MISFMEKIISHSDGSVWCHVELVGVQTDNYKVVYTPEDETIFNYNVPGSISVVNESDNMSVVAESTAESVAVNSTRSNVSRVTTRSSKSSSNTSGINISTTSPTNAKIPPSAPPMLVTPTILVKSNPNQNRVIEGEYDGFLNRTKSVKRAAKSQDIEL